VATYPDSILPTKFDHNFIRKTTYRTPQKKTKTTVDIMVKYLNATRKTLSAPCAPEEHRNPEVQKF
jgi:hypothetical protein